MDRVTYGFDFLTDRELLEIVPKPDTWPSGDIVAPKFLKLPKKTKIFEILKMGHTNQVHQYRPNKKAQCLSCQKGLVNCVACHLCSNGLS